MQVFLIAGAGYMDGYKAAGFGMKGHDQAGFSMLNPAVPDRDRLQRGAA